MPRATLKYMAGVIMWGCMLLTETGGCDTGQSCWHHARMETNITYKAL